MINPDMEKVREVSTAVDRLLAAAILRVVEMGLGSEIVILHERDAQVVCVGPIPVYRVRVGPFEKKEAAESSKAKLDSAGLATALVRVQR